MPDPALAGRIRRLTWTVYGLIALVVVLLVAGLVAFLVALPRLSTQPVRADDDTVLFGPAPLHVPRSPGVLARTVADLDTFTVTTSAASTEAADLVYDRSGLRGGSGAHVGFGPAVVPSPTTCAADAFSRATGALAPATLSVNETALCVVTTEGNVAWLLLVEKDDVDLVFEALVWTRSGADSLTSRRAGHQ